MTRPPPRVALAHVPEGRGIVRVERMSPAFVKYHLDDGQALHRFTRAEPHADPHDHPWGFETHILAGGYVEEVFHPCADGGWRSAIVHRHPGETYRIAAEHIHRIVELPQRDCWTLVAAGPHERETRFWRFGDDMRVRLWRERRWRVVGGARVGAI